MHVHNHVQVRSTVTSNRNVLYVTPRDGNGILSLFANEQRSVTYHLGNLDLFNSLITGAIRAACTDQMSLSGWG